MHVENGLGERETFRVAEFQAYYRRVRERFLAALADEPETYAWPCDHCGICDFRHLCWQQRRRRRPPDARRRDAAASGRDADGTGIATLEALGEHAARSPGLADARHGACGRRRSSGVRHQAELQLRGRREDRYLHELLPDEEERGFRLLPEPDDGDVWFDMEGHPFYETARGLEYLFGYCYRDEDGEVVYEAVWGRDRDGERVRVRAVRRLGRRAPRAATPACTSTTTPPTSARRSRRLMGEHGTREQEVDDFLREEVLVDLYRVVKQALRASTDELLDQGDREALRLRAHRRGRRRRRVGRPLRGVGRDRRRRDPRATIERYNEEDCRSTVRAARVAARSGRPDLPWRLPPDEREPTEEAEERDDERAALRGAAARRRRRRASRAGCSRTSSTTTSARRGRSGGRGSAGRSSTTTS